MQNGVSAGVYYARPFSFFYFKTSLPCTFECSLEVKKQTVVVMQTMKEFGDDYECVVIQQCKCSGSARQDTSGTSVRACTCDFASPPLRHTSMDALHHRACEAEEEKEGVWGGGRRAENVHQVCSSVMTSSCV